MGITTSIELWSNYNDDTALDSNILSVQHIGNNKVTRLYFTGRAVDMGCSRVYAEIVSACSSRHAIIIVGNANKPVDSAELSFWADKGFVAMGIDYAGNSNDGVHTIYPPALDYANYNNSNDRFIGEQLHNSKWYEYAVNTRRAISYLLSVGVDKVSILSYGSGSRIATMALATDDRLTNGAILFGSLYEQLPYLDSNEVDVDSNRQEVEQSIADNEVLQQWELLYSPQSYVHNIQAPIYMLASGNSQYTDITTLSESYYRTNDNSCLMVLPDTFDYCHNGILDGVARWIVGNGTVEDIELSYTSCDGVLTISASTVLPLEHLQLWYCRNGSDKGRHWNRTLLQPTDTAGMYSATVELYQHNTQLLALATYHGDIAVSSPLLTVDIDSSYNLSHAVPVLYRGGTPFRFVALSNGGEWHGMSNGIDQTTGYLDIAGARGCILATFAGNDGSVLMGDSDTITMDVCCDIRQQLSVLLIHDYGEQEIWNTATVQLVGDGKWQKIVLEADQFREPNGQAMDRNKHADVMVFYADDLFIINNICMI